MKKLYVVIALVILFAFSNFITPILKAEDSIITLTLPEHKVEEDKIQAIEKIDLEGIEVVYCDPEEEKAQEQTYSYSNNTTYNNYTNNVSYNQTSTASGCDGRLGNIGRLVIPSVGYSAALNNGLTGNAQGIVDAYDSACYIAYDFCTTYIGDHYYQGFVNMKNAVPGATYAYIYWNDGSVSTYLCVEKHYNAVKRGYVYDENGVDIYDSGYDIAMVTCNDATSVSVTVTYWTRV